jgi:hypothetical protein
MAEKVAPVGKGAEAPPVVLESKIIDINQEDENLWAMGYEQHMSRGFTSWSMISFCMTGLGLLPSLGGERQWAEEVVHSQGETLTLPKAPSGSAWAILACSQ